MVRGACLKILPGPANISGVFEPDQYGRFISAFGPPSCRNVNVPVTIDIAGTDPFIRSVLTDQGCFPGGLIRIVRDFDTINIVFTRDQ